MAQEIGLPKERTENQTVSVWMCWQCESLRALCIKGGTRCSDNVLQFLFFTRYDPATRRSILGVSNVLTSVEALLSTVQCRAAEAYCCGLYFNVKDFH
jgi:hypothetical protein